jgi:hypothetical protein
MGKQSGWSFVKSHTGGWMWRHLPVTDKAVSRHSSRTFPTLADCIADAKLHGYNPKASVEQARSTLFP